MCCLMSVFPSALMLLENTALTSVFKMTAFLRFLEVSHCPLRGSFKSPE